MQRESDPMASKNLCLFKIVVEIVDRSPHPPLGQRITDRPLNMLAHPFDHLKGRLKVSLIIDRIKTAEDVNPHLC